MSTRSLPLPALVPVHSPARGPRLLLLVLLVLGLALPLLALGPAAQAGQGERRQKREQALELQLLPGISQAGPRPAPSAAADHLAEVAVVPAVAGRPVRVERWTGEQWRTVATGQTDEDGLAELDVPAAAGRPAYRAVADAWGGADSARSGTVVDRWGDPTYVDEFDGSALGADWGHRVQFANPWGGRSCSKGDPSAVSVGEGVLRLTSAVDPTRSDLCPAVAADGSPLGSWPYRVNANISTQASHDFLYGVAAARMRFPRSVGQHAAFWLQPRGLLETGPTPWGAEVDVVEWYGARGKREIMGSAVHEPQPDGSKRQIGGTIRNPDRFLATRSDRWWTRFHVFSVQWTPAEYVFRIDHHLVWRTSQGVSDVPEFLILSMLSNDFELPMVGTDPTPRTAEVDWAGYWETGR